MLSSDYNQQVTTCNKSCVAKNNEYVDKFIAQFTSDKFIVDTVNECVINTYFNPDSSDGGEIICNKISYELLSEAFYYSADEPAFWDYLDSSARQTYISVGSEDFKHAALSFVEEPWDFSERSKRTMESLCKLVYPEKPKNEEG